MPPQVYAVWRSLEYAHSARSGFWQRWHGMPRPPAIRRRHPREHQRRPKSQTSWLSVLAAPFLCVALLGIHGVVSQTVSAHSRLRCPLGSGRTAILGAVGTDTIADRRAPLVILHN